MLAKQQLFHSTVTSDFAAAVLGDSGKQDRSSAAPRLRLRGDDAAAARAETGMRILEQETTQLTSPTDEDVNATIEKLRDIYSAAYGWDAPLLERKAGGVSFQRMMRYKVRASINEWDLLRLYPNSQPETEGTEFRPGYEETPELEQETKDDGDEGSTGISPTACISTRPIPPTGTGTRLKLAAGRYDSSLPIWRVSGLLPSAGGSWLGPRRCVVRR